MIIRLQGHYTLVKQSVFNQDLSPFFKSHFIKS